MTTLPLPHRYLVQFNPRRTPHYFVDVLIIGGGLAGLRAALAVPADLEVLVVTKDKMQESNSQYAQGGIAGVLDPEDRFENHIEDTIKAGAGLCDRDVVEAVVREAPERLEELVRWGCDFDRQGDKLALTLEGGHSHRRIVHALGDATGQEVMRAVIAKTRAAPNVQLWEDTFTLDLLTEKDVDGRMKDESKTVVHPSSFILHPSRCCGAVIHRPNQGILLVWAKQTILASGGAGCLYRETTNPPVATGDGMALAYRAGAALRDMEFMQFHPTVLYVAGSSRCLISEAVRGEGGRLIDKNGERFMPAVDSRAELAPRDIVARAIARQMEKTQHPSVYLDLSHLEPEHIRRRFPHIDRVCRSYDIDITRDPIPVRPGAHYMVGGVTVDLDGRTSLPGLWAAGEVTSSGLHGANRLASNSLLEGLVFGARCGAGAASEVRRLQSAGMAPSTIESEFTPERGPLDIADSKNSLQSLMWRKAGIVRDGDGLEEALSDVEFWCRYILAHEFTSREGWELQNMLTIARLMLWSAQQREESRGVHYRSDYPEAKPAWALNVTVPPA
jgi:L-aspartate oxidase